MELNELGNADKEVIQYHSNPVLMGLNGAKLPSDFIRTKNACVEIEKKDSKFEYLVWEGKLEESRERQESIRRALTLVTGISLISRGFLKEIGQIRSGPPLKALFSSDRSVMSRKFKCFHDCEVQDMKADVLFYQYNSGVNLNYDKKVTFNIKFEDDFLGIDALLDAEIKTLQTQSNTKSIAEIMREEHPDWSEKDINSAIDEMSKMMKKMQPKQMTSSPDKKGMEQE